MRSERHIALRAEMTPTLARMVAQRQKELVFPLAEIYTHGEEVGRCPSLLDSMIGATALAHGMAMVTRNVRDFQFEGLKVINPFD